MEKKCLPFSSWVAGVPEQTASQPCPRRLLLLDPQQRPGEAMPQPSRPWPKGLSAQQLRPQTCSLRRVETRLRKEDDRSRRLAARGLGWPLFPVGATVWTRLGGVGKRARGEEEIYPKSFGGRKLSSSRTPPAEPCSGALEQRTLQAVWWPGKVVGARPTAMPA